MTVRMRELKGPPLLEPPKEAGEPWRFITHKDVAAMQSYRKDFHPATGWSAYIEMYYYMKNLGVPFTLDRKDADEVRAALADYRKRRDGSGIAKMLFYGNGVGLRLPTMPGDEEAMVKSLDLYRSDAIGDYWSVAHQLYMMKGIKGVSCPMTAADRRMMRERLDMDREFKRESHGLMIHWMRGLGIDVEMNDDERIRMREEAKNRERRFNGSGIAAHLFLLERLMPIKTEEGRGSGRMPPLKRYAGRR